jgi:hypothetical protein
MWVNLEYNLVGFVTIVQLFQLLCIWPSTLFCVTVKYEIITSAILVLGKSAYGKALT